MWSAWAAGDMIPADLRILEAKDLFISQSSLTGESEPVEKFAGLPDASPDAPDSPPQSPLDCADLAFMGSNVVSGSALALVLAVGNATLFGLPGPPDRRHHHPHQFRQGRQRRVLAADPFHGLHGAHCLFHQRLHQGRLGGRPRSSPCPWPWA